MRSEDTEALNCLFRRHNGTNSGKVVPGGYPASTRDRAYISFYVLHWLCLIWWCWRHVVVVVAVVVVVVVALSAPLSPKGIDQASRNCTTSLGRSQRSLGVRSVGFSRQLKRWCTSCGDCSHSRQTLSTDTDTRLRQQLRRLWHVSSSSSLSSSSCSSSSSSSTSSSSSSLSSSTATTTTDSTSSQQRHG